MPNELLSRVNLGTTYRKQKNTLHDVTDVNAPEGEWYVSGIAWYEENMSDEYSFGIIAKNRRRELGLTQDELAHRVGCAPITDFNDEGHLEFSHLSHQAGKMGTNFHQLVVWDFQQKFVVHLQDQL